MTCAPSEDLDQPGHPPSLISLLCLHEETLGPLPIECTVKTDQTGQTVRLICVFAGCTSFCWFCCVVVNVRIDESVCKKKNPDWFFTRNWKFRRSGWLLMLNSYTCNRTLNWHITSFKNSYILSTPNRLWNLIMCCCLNPVRSTVPSPGTREPWYLEPRGRLLLPGTVRTSNGTEPGCYRVLKKRSRYTFFIVEMKIIVVLNFYRWYCVNLTGGPYGRVVKVANL